GAGRVGHQSLERHLVLVEELLDRLDELLPDLLVLIVREDGDRPDEPDRAPGHRERRPDDLGLIFLGHEAAPRLHEPAVMHVLGTAEWLTGAGSELALQEIRERLLDDVANLGEIALSDPADLNLGGAALRIDADAVDRCPHADTPARSSSSVMTAE